MLLTLWLSCQFFSGTFRSIEFDLGLGGNNADSNKGNETLCLCDYHY